MRASFWLFARLGVVIKKFRFQINFLIGTVAAFALFCFNVPGYAFHDGEHDETTIYGAGAHFAWTIFNSLKPDLQKLVNREIILFGKNSMLGQGCNAGIKMAKQNKPGHETFGFVCCPLNKQEVEKEGLVVYPLALEPIVIMVNSSNPVKNLSTQQVREIFAGKITNWQEVGGADQPIVVVTRLHCKSRPGHWKTILPSKKLFRPQRLNVSSSDEMVQRISDFPGAIGHTGSTWIREPGQSVKHITVEGIAPTAENLENKRYPFYRPLSAITNKNPSADILKIINEVQVGPAFQTVAKQYELLPLNHAK
jgi:phosphate transport system substrate-binding protein